MGKRKKGSRKTRDRIRAKERQAELAKLRDKLKVTQGELDSMGPNIMELDVQESQTRKKLSKSTKTRDKAQSYVELAKLKGQRGPARDVQAARSTALQNKRALEERLSEVQMSAEAEFGGQISEGHRQLAKDNPRAAGWDLAEREEMAKIDRDSTLIADMESKGFGGGVLAAMKADIVSRKRNLQDIKFELHGHGGVTTSDSTGREFMVPEKNTKSERTTEYLPPRVDLYNDEKLTAVERPARAQDVIDTSIKGDPRPPGKKDIRRDVGPEGFERFK